MTPTVLLMPARSVRAAWLGRYISVRAETSTRSRRASRTTPGFENTREAVAIDTPAWSATSRTVVV
jgi:hypothetical protein